MARVRTRRLAVVAVAAAALMTGTADATVIHRESFVDEPYSFSHDDCGFQVDVEGTQSAKEHLRVGKGKTDTAFFDHFAYSFVETHTNTETGTVLTIKADAMFNELKATRVEGSIFEFTQVEAGRFRLYDSDGRLVGFDRGNVRIHILFDTEGDDVPGGIFIEELDAVAHGPHTSDYCGLLGS